MPVCRHDGADVLIRVKAVPGASRDAMCPPLGDRIKIAVAAPPDGGKANRAIERLLAQAIGVSPRHVTIDSGHGSALKTVRIQDVDLASVEAALPV